MCREMTKEKESGMEKLIELFKEYVDNHGTDTKDIEKEYGVIDDGQGLQYGTREYLYEIIVSKKFGFIKWLVENEKIDVKEIGKIGMTKMKGEPTSYMFDKIYSDLESLLMLLSIQDEPIEFLVSILK